MNQPFSVHTQQALLQQLSAGSEHAFTEIFNHYKTPIYTVALRLLKSPVAAEEIVQDVFLKVWLKRAELKEVQRLDNYLFIMARNFILDRIKKTGYQLASQTELVKHATQQSTTHDTEYLVRQHQCEQVIHDAIERLSPQQKQVYNFARYQELSHEVIAVKMGLSRLTVKKHMAKGLQSVRQYLQTHLHHLPLLSIIATLVAGK